MREEEFGGLAVDAPSVNLGSADHESCALPCIGVWAIFGDKYYVKCI